MKFEKVIAITKASETETGSLRIVGTCTQQIKDTDNELGWYPDLKKEYQAYAAKFRDVTTNAGVEPSAGVVRFQHDAKQPCGKWLAYYYCDDEQRIDGECIIDEPYASKVRRGMATFFSHSGEYRYRKCLDCDTDIPGRGNYCPSCRRDVIVRYSAEIREISLVDSGACQTCVVRNVQLVKRDGRVITTPLEKKGNSMKLKNHVLMAIQHHDGEAATHLTQHERHKSMSAHLRKLLSECGDDDMDSEKALRMLSPTAVSKAADDDDVGIFNVDRVLKALGNDNVDPLADLRKSLGSK